MAVNVNNFLESLCRFVAAAASPPLAYTTTPRALWRGEVHEAAASLAVPYSTVRISGGPELSHDPMPRRAVQVLTYDEDPDAAMARAQLIFESLCDAQGHPWCNKTIDGFTTAGAADGTWRLVYIRFVQPPSPVGVDENRRNVVSFNFDVGFHKAS